MRIIDKIFRDKKGNTVIYLLLTVGVLLLLSGNMTNKKPYIQPEENISFSEADSLKRVLSSIKGVGNTEVMISFEKEKASDSLFDEDKEEKGGVKGVVIVADGGNDTKVREKIIRATKAALGVEIHKIEVFERKE